MRPFISFACSIGCVLAITWSFTHDASAAERAAGAGRTASANLRAGTYDFPYRDPYLSTLSIRLLKLSAATPRIFEMEGLPGREKVRFAEGRQRLETAVFVQRAPAPLVFVIPGVGGAATDGSALWLGEQAYLAGFSAIVISSPFYWKFVLSQSSTGVPGYMPEDARDLRRLMVAVKARAERELGLRVTRSAVMGYSLGAVNVAFIMKQEREQPLLALERAVMINPPLHIPHAIATLDRLYEVGHSWSLEYRNRVWGHVLGVGSALLDRDIRNSSYFLGLDQVLLLSNTQLKYLIGDSFRQMLADTIFMGQEVNDIGLLKETASPKSRTARQLEAASISFTDYMSRAVWPFWTQRLKQKWTLPEFINQTDMQSLRDMLENDPSFRLLHNQDDFLTLPEDLERLATRMGNRAVIYPYRGHVGNLWFGENRADLLAAIRDLL